MAKGKSWEVRAIHVGAAEDICIHLYNKGHAKNYTKHLIAEALAAAEAKLLPEWVAQRLERA